MFLQLLMLASIAIQQRENDPVFVVYIEKLYEWRTYVAELSFDPVYYDRAVNLIGSIDKTLALSQKMGQRSKSKVIEMVNLLEQLRVSQGGLLGADDAQEEVLE